MADYHTFSFAPPREYLAHFNHQACSWFDGDRARDSENTRYSVRFFPGERPGCEEKSETHLVLAEVVDFQGRNKERELFGLPKKSRFLNFRRTGRGEIPEASTEYGRDSFFELLLPEHPIKVGDTWEWSDCRPDLWDLCRRTTFAEVLESATRGPIARFEGHIFSLPCSRQTVSARETFYFSMEQGQVLLILTEGDIEQEGFHRHFIFSKREKATLAVLEEFIPGGTVYLEQGQRRLAS